MTYIFATLCLLLIFKIRQVYRLKKEIDRLIVKNACIEADAQNIQNNFDELSIEYTKKYKGVSLHKGSRAFHKGSQFNIN